MCDPIPVFLNRPDKVVFWTWKEIGTFLSTVFFVWCTSSFVLGLFMGALMVKALRALQSHPLGDLTQLGVYAFLPSQRHFKSLIPSDIRELLG
ncbi:MAG: hypothetical protein KBD23_00680 [Gammaproteobacteria bacterium]|nr:hypothetical protein [Gammaproteobacteria bacterium]